MSSTDAVHPRGSAAEHEPATQVRATDATFGGVGGRWLLAAVSVALLAGGFLRLRNLDAQFLLDDEWHSLMLAVRHDLGWIATHFAFAANSIPFNLYARATLMTTGWSEWILRLPSIAAGLGLLWCMYRFRRSTRPADEVPLAVALLAVSPLAIYYSRIIRPYGLHLLLSFLITVEAYQWAKTGRIRRAWWFGVLSALALWVHQVALFPVLAGWLLVWWGPALSEWKTPSVWSWLRSLAGAGKTDSARSGDSFPQRWGAPFQALAAAAAAAVVLLFPPLLRSGEGFAEAYASKEMYNLETLAGFASLMAGSANVAVIALFWGLVLVGLVREWRMDRTWFWLVGLSLVVHFAALAALRPPYLGQPIVLVRYTLDLLPVLLLCAADGVAWGLAALGPLGRRSGGVALQASLVVALVAFGPLPNTLRQGGNFEHHATYQEDYGDVPGAPAHKTKLRRLVDLSEREVSEFYKDLARGTGGAIVEFPFPLGHDFCIAAYFQRTHGRPVFGGYLGSGDLEELSSPWISGLHTTGSLMRVLPPGGGVRWSRFVDITDLAALKRSGAEYLTVHLNPLLEPARREPWRDTTRICEMEPVFVAAVDRELRRLATPVYTDSWMSVYRIADLAQGVPVPADSPATYRVRAENARKSGRTAEALELVERGLDINPDDLLTVMLSALVYDDINDGPKSSRQYLRALKLSKGRTDRDMKGIVHLREGFAARGATLARELGMHQEAAAMFEELAAMRSPTSSELGYWGQSLREIGRHDEAVRCFRQILANNPEDAGTWYELALTLMRAERLAESSQAFREGLSRRPSGQGAILLAEVSLSLRDTAAARSALELAARLTPPGSPDAARIRKMRDSLQPAGR